MDDQDEIIRVGTINGWAFKVAIWFAPIFAIWMTTKVLAHDTDIAVLKMQIAMQGGGKVSKSVNVGQTKDGQESQMTAKTWLTTKDVAEREGITERTVINYIENGMIEPPPNKNGKAWQIAEDFRIVPKDSESGGTVANAKLQPEEAKP